MGVNENERDYRPLHLDTNLSKGTVCSKKDMGVNEHETLSNTILRQKFK